MGRHSVKIILQEEPQKLEMPVNDKIRCKGDNCPTRWKQKNDVFYIYYVETYDGEYIVAKCTVCGCKHIIAHEERT